MMAMLVGLQQGNTTNYGAAAAATLTGAAGVQDMFTALVLSVTYCNSWHCGYNQYSLYISIQTWISIHRASYSLWMITIPVWWQAAPQTGMPPPILHSLPFQIWQDHDSSAYEHCCCRLLPWTRAQPMGKKHGILEVRTCTHTPDIH